MSSSSLMPFPLRIKFFVNFHIITRIFFMFFASTEQSKTIPVEVLVHNFPATYSTNDNIFTVRCYFADTVRKIEWIEKFRKNSKNCLLTCCCLLHRRLFVSSKQWDSLACYCSLYWWTFCWQFKLQRWNIGEHVIGYLQQFQSFERRKWLYIVFFIFTGTNKWKISFINLNANLIRNFAINSYRLVTNNFSICPVLKKMREVC